MTIQSLHDNESEDNPSTLNENIYFFLEYACRCNGWWCTYDTSISFL